MNNKNYYILKNAKNTLVCFEVFSGQPQNIEEFEDGKWMSASYDTQEIVKKAVNFDIINNPAIATKITSESQLDEIVVKKIRESLNQDEKF